MDMIDTIKGSIEKIIFKSEDNNFSIFIVAIASDKTIIARGNLMVHPGQFVQLQGAWVNHPKFGRQFDVRACLAEQPNSITGLKKYLGSGLIKGIGKVYAEKLVARFGADVLQIIEQQPNKLQEVPGIGPKRIAQIQEAWHMQKEISSIMIFLQEKGISTAYATKIFKKYGHESIVLMKENPYRLAEDIWGIGFKTADKIAQQLGFQPDSGKRIKAGILFAISDATGRGHLYVELEQLKELTTQLLELSEQTTVSINQALNQLHAEDKIKVITYQQLHFITLSQYYFSEFAVAKRLKLLMQQPSPLTFDLASIYHQLRTTKASDIELNEDQQQGILTCLQSKISIITGGPGTGKTTLIKKLLSILDAKKIRYRLAAPTGKAAKRMFEGTGKSAETLHRLLEFDPAIMTFKHNENNALIADFLIIDEASMIDIFLAHALLKAISFGTHVVFIGDIDQLPSVGAGNFLGDMIASGIIPSIKLTKVFRQAQDSMIIANAHKINRGEFPSSAPHEGKRDFFYIKEEDPAMVIQHCKTIIAKIAKIGLKPEDLTVLVPMNRGIAGTFKINQDLQQLLNGGQQKQLHYMGTIFKVGDKVMQIRNNYDKLVFNGDTGIIVDVDQEEKTITVNVDGRMHTYEHDELNELVLAYAISIHKSQGSEYDAVAIPLFMQHFMLLQRNLLYTAITRAKKVCFFIGQARAIAMAIKNSKVIVRNTFLGQFLTTDLQCR